MILDNAIDTSYIFNLFLYPCVTREYKNLPNLIKSEGSEYPKNPKSGKNRDLWNEVSLLEMLERKGGNTPYRVMICNHLAKLYYEKYKNSNKRISKSTENFVKLVINISLFKGFDGTVISVGERDMIPTGLKKDAGRNALKKLHDLGITICLLGGGYYDNDIKMSASTGFMLYPKNEKLIGDLVTRLTCGKMQVNEIDNIKLEDYK